jgi:hypothetical protein
MLNGHFKIGSHAEYSGSEGTGLLSDNSEGDGGIAVTGNFLRFTGELAGNYFHNCTFVSTGDDVITVHQKINCAIFCASRGPYDAQRHKAIVEGSASYPPNPDTTAFLILDAEKLLSALTMATDELLRQRTRWVFRPLIYSERLLKIPSSKFTGLPQASMAKRLVDQAFTKPARFKIEEEMRFVMIPAPHTEIPSRIFTSELSPAVQNAFKSAIAGVGE